MGKISVVISAFNEEKNLKGCLESIKDLADEIIVVDNGSADKTSKIAHEFTKKVYVQENDPNKIDLQKNFGYSKASGAWILSLDADERVTKELAIEIKEKTNDDLITNNDAVVGYWIPRENIIFGKKIVSDMWSPDYQLKLFKKGKGKFEDSTVHKALVVNGETEKLVNALVHNNYDSISQYIMRLNIYTDIEADNLAKDGYSLNFLDSVRFPVDDFVKTFFLQKGYRDGLHGLVLSILQAFYMEVVFAKLWEKRGFEVVEGEVFLNEVGKEFKNSAEKFKYWILTSSINNSKNPFRNILLKTSRKITSSKIKTS